jgi:hypothetical protein
MYAAFVLLNSMRPSCFRRGAGMAHHIRRQQMRADRSILLSAEDRTKVLHDNAQHVLQL